MKSMKIKSLEGRWDILYREYPEVYEEFGRIAMAPDIVDVVSARSSLQVKTVVDVGSGTGLSTFKLAQHAGVVFGIEIEKAMLSKAVKNARERDVENVRFCLGTAEHLPLGDGSMDAAVAMTLADRDPEKTAAEMERVVRPGGLVLRVDVAPGWYGGDVLRHVSGEPDEAALPGSRDDILARSGYEMADIFTHQEYATVERIVHTYGFIHSESAIAYIQERELTAVNWKFRIRSKKLPET